MTEFTKSNLEALRTEMQTVLLAHDFNETINLQLEKINVGNCRYSSGEATFQVKFVIEGGKTREQQDLEFYAELLGLDTDKTCKLRGEDMKLSGYKSRARKNKWVLQRLRDGAEFVCSEHIAKQFFKKEETVQ
tara:strand:- start:213 stop:611 length:399 start_codon:yes stop_codon:yes gene_type:complete